MYCKLKITSVKQCLNIQRKTLVLKIVYISFKVDCISVIKLIEIFKNINNEYLCD